MHSWMYAGISRERDGYKIVITYALRKMAIILVTLSNNTSNRVVKRRFNYLLQTIHFYFHEVLWAMIKFSTEVIVSLSNGTNPNQIMSHHRLWEIFKVTTHYPCISNTVFRSINNVNILVGCFECIERHSCACRCTN